MRLRWGFGMLVGMLLQYSARAARLGTSAWRDAAPGSAVLGIAVDRGSEHREARQRDLRSVCGAHPSRPAEWNCVGTSQF